MVNNPESEHRHSGMSTRSLLNPEMVLKEIGLKKGDTFWMPDAETAIFL
ncbi:MAG: hypothetical protein V3R96_01220 [Dehalococcoidales bacterium]